MIVLQHLSYNPTQEHEKKKENLNQGSDIREKNPLQTQELKLETVIYQNQR